MTYKIFVPNIGSMDEAIPFYLDVRNSIEMQYGRKAAQEFGNSVRVIGVDADGTIHVHLHANVNTERMSKTVRGSGADCPSRLELVICAVYIDTKSDARWLPLLSTQSQLPNATGC